MTEPSERILVTGAAGWLGFRLVKALTKGLSDYPEFRAAGADAQIHCLVLPGQDASALRSLGPQIRICEGDIRNAAECARFCSDGRGALLFHTAGIIHPRRISDFYAINVRGCENLLQAAIQAGVKRAVIVSSNSPCGCNPHPDHLFDELSPYHPYMHYGRSKMQMEQLVRNVQESGAIETVVIRPPWFYGPNQPARQTLFFTMIRQGKAPIVGSGENLRSMSYVDNLCLGLMLASKVEQANGRTYWIADEHPYSMNAIVDTVEHLLEKEFGLPCAHRRMRLPNAASEVAFAVDYLMQSAGLYHQKVHVLSEMNKTIACSVAKASRDLGYRPTIRLEEGMRRSLRWCIEQGIKI